MLKATLFSRVWAVALIAVLTAMGAWSAPVGSNDVARAIGSWRHCCGTLGAKMGEKVKDVRTASDSAALAKATSESKTKNAFILATFNVRTSGAKDKGEHAWYRRMPRVAQIVREHSFDVFGVQEATPFEVAILEAELQGFVHVGCGRDKDRQGEAMLIFFRKSRFECLESDTFWLSETPDVPGSKFAGAKCPRTCTWALLRDVRTGKKFRYFNTHLDHISSRARWNGMKVLLEYGVRPAKARGETVFLTGDLNETLDKKDDPKAVLELNGQRLAERARENAIALALTELTDAYAMSVTPHGGTFQTYHGFKGRPICRIDYIFATSDAKILTHKTLNDKPEGQFASDHYPVAATVQLQE